jgi:hypothetical protein
MTDFCKGVIRDEGYFEWQKMRIETLLKEEKDDNFFKGKKVLELGCYKGGVSQMVHNLGGLITASYHSCRR